jgi:hypothetical protein
MVSTCYLFFNISKELIEALTIDNERPPLPEATPPTLTKLILSSWRADPDLRPTFADMLRANVWNYGFTP